MSAEKLAKLRGRLESVRSHSRETDTSHELETALGELEVLWEELEQQADALAFERHRYAFLYEQAPYACLVTDMNGMVREANRSAYRLLDLPALHVVRKPLALFIAEADRPLFRSRLARALIEPKKPVEPFRVALKLACASPRVEMQIQCQPEGGERPASMMCFLRRLD